VSAARFAGGVEEACLPGLVSGFTKDEAILTCCCRGGVRFRIFASTSGESGGRPKSGCFVELDSTR